VNTRATSFGRRADDYDRVRPDYREDAIDLAVERLGLRPDADVLDLGAGTGKLTRPLVDRFARVVAVEPDPGMRAVLTRATEAYRVLEGCAEEIPLPDASVDAVFVGQAFHWFDRARVFPELARVLRPRAGLVLLWNSWLRDAEPPFPPEAVELMESVTKRVVIDPQRMDSGEWEWPSKFEGTAFEELREETFETGRWALDAERLVSLYLTTSPYGTLPPDELATVERRLRELIVGEHTLPLRAELYWTRLAT
jgi:SAM-dependent methyltransferase